MNMQNHFVHEHPVNSETPCKWPASSHRLPNARRLDCKEEFRDARDEMAHRRQINCFLFLSEPVAGESRPFQMTGRSETVSEQPALLKEFLIIQEKSDKTVKDPSNPLSTSWVYMFFLGFHCPCLQVSSSCVRAPLVFFHLVLIQHLLLQFLAHHKSFIPS